MTAPDLPDGPGVYIIHIDPPLAHARNYLGSARNLRARIAADLAGTGARLPAAALAAGRVLTVSRIWELGNEAVARQAEAGLKERRQTPDLCPECTPGTTQGAVPRLRAQRRPNRNPPRRRAR